MSVNQDTKSFHTNPLLPTTTSDLTPPNTQSNHNPLIKPYTTSARHIKNSAWALLFLLGIIGTTIWVIFTFINHNKAVDQFKRSHRNWCDLDDRNAPGGLCRGDNDPRQPPDNPGGSIVASVLSLICFAMVYFGAFSFYWSRSSQVGHALGALTPAREVPNPDVRKFVNPEEKVISVSWVNVMEARRVLEQLRGAQPICEVEGTVWQDPNDDDYTKICVGRHWERVAFERWEDPMGRYVLREVEQTLDVGDYDVLKITIKTSCKLQSEHLQTTEQAFITDFEINYRNYLPIKPTPPRNWTYETQTKLVSSFQDPFPPPTQPFRRGYQLPNQERLVNNVEEKVLFVYKGEKRPWWTDVGWYRWCFWLHVGWLWEWSVGKRYGVVDVELQRWLY
ncbi:hypothetical protein HDV00_001487 [Rhizophlyctis rosea]|nr:hypothetical protein HDV00_001487 [Rhizophlyctis rosea]